MRAGDGCRIDCLSLIVAFLAVLAALVAAVVMYL
jgi:hypothetical protein